MKTIYGFGLALVLASAVPAMSTERDGGNYQICKQALHSLYGDGVRVSLRSIIRKPDGDRLRIKVTGEGASRMLTCRISAGSGVELTDSEGIVPMHAPSDYDATEKLTKLD